ncbi:hypothetical protein [Halovenus salina]|uniref:Uncharacterized protein n=1 Tax=Halovenus salina TaxID=1510225 RepID=A0ABD5VZR4_9EURY
MSSYAETLAENVEEQSEADQSAPETQEKPEEPPVVSTNSLSSRPSVTASTPR